MGEGGGIPTKPKFKNDAPEGPCTQNDTFFVTGLVLVTQKLGSGAVTEA